MTTSKPLSQIQLDELRPTLLGSLVIHDHNSELGNIGWILVNGRFLSNQEVEALEAERDKLLAENKHQDSALMSQENRYWEKVKELQKAESALGRARELIHEWRLDAGSRNFGGIYGESKHADELEKTLAKYCTKADAEGKTP